MQLIINIHCNFICLSAMINFKLKDDKVFYENEEMWTPKVNVGVVSEKLVKAYRIS